MHGLSLQPSSRGSRLTAAEQLREWPGPWALPQAQARLSRSQGPLGSASAELTKKGIRPAALSSSRASCRAEARMANLSSEGMAFNLTPPTKQALSTEEWAWKRNTSRVTPHSRREPSPAQQRAHAPPQPPPPRSVRPRRRLSSPACPRTFAPGVSQATWNLAFLTD